MARHLAASGIAHCFLGIAILAMSCQAVLADTVTLICDNPYHPDNPPFTLELDQAQGTVTQTFSATQYSPAGSSKYAATFDAREIKYTIGDFAYAIDRVTGNLTATSNPGNPRVVMNFPCHVGKTQF